METLFLFNNNLTGGYIFNSLNILTLLAILSGILVVSCKNPIISVLFLIGLFATLSIYLIILGLSFIGLSYLIVYIGAVSILFLFILMLINIRISELQTNNTSNSIIISIIVIITFNYPLFGILPYNIAAYAAAAAAAAAILNYNYYIYNLNELKQNLYIILKQYNIYNENIFFISSNTWDGYLAENNHLTSIGNIMYTNYNIWLIIASFILLLAMVGAIVITIRQK